VVGASQLATRPIQRTRWRGHRSRSSLP